MNWLDSDIYQLNNNGILGIWNTCAIAISKWWNHGGQHQLFVIWFFSTLIYSIIMTVWALGMTNRKTCRICRKELKDGRK